MFPSSEFLRIALKVVAGATTAMPLPPFPQMTLPSAPSVAEPIVLLDELEIRMPWPVLASAVALPFGMPTVLRRTEAPLAEPLSTMPLPPLADTRFRRTVAPVEELVTTIPFVVFPSAPVPAALTPTRLLMIWTLLPEST